MTLQLLMAFNLFHGRKRGSTNKEYKLPCIKVVLNYYCDHEFLNCKAVFWYNCSFTMLFEIYMFVIIVRNSI